MSLRPEDVQPPIRTPRSRDFYLAYLNTPAWRARRNRALQLAGYQCQRCPAKRDLEVHHLSYERLGAEADGDLEVVCPDCHRGEHIEEAQGTELGIYLKIASEALRTLGPWASIADLSDCAKTLCAQRHIDYQAFQIDKALGLICGTRLKAVRPGLVREPHVIGEMADHDVTKLEAYELVSRLFATASMSGINLNPLIKVFPGGIDQAAHERRLREQIEASHRFDRPKRRPVMERLEAIFSGAE